MNHTKLIVGLATTLLVLSIVVLTVSDDSLGESDTHDYQITTMHNGQTCIWYPETNYEDAEYFVSASAGAMPISNHAKTSGYASVVGKSIVVSIPAEYQSVYYYVSVMAVTNEPYQTAYYQLTFNLTIYDPIQINSYSVHGIADQTRFIINGNLVVPSTLELSEVTATMTHDGKTEQLAISGDGVAQYDKLTIDTTTGNVTGKLGERGTYELTVKYTGNIKGTDETVQTNTQTVNFIINDAHSTDSMGWGIFALAGFGVILVIFLLLAHKHRDEDWGSDD